jgi:hypothetical protein
MKDIPLIQRYVQTCIAVLLMMTVALHFGHSLLSKKINKRGKTYMKAELITTFSAIQKKYNIDATIAFKPKGVPAYDMLTSTITMPEKEMFFQTDYFTLLHEVAHAIDFQTGNNRNLVIKLKIMSVSGAMLCYIAALILLLTIQLPFSIHVATILCLIAICCGVSDVGLTLKIERAANNILIRELGCSNDKLYAKVAEASQIIERLLILICLAILFLVLRTNLSLVLAYFT